MIKLLSINFIASCFEFFQVRYEVQILGVFWPIIQFPGRFFAQYGVLSFWLFFTPKTTHFWTYLDLEWHLDGA